MPVKSSSHKSTLHELISKDSTRMLIAVSVAVFIVIFCLFAARSLFSQSLYQNRVISEKKATLKVVEENKKAANNLEASYVSFATEPINVLGGSPTGTGPKDGDNAKIVLDALPDQLDYPALSSSIEKILLDGGYVIQSIGGGNSAVSATTEPSATSTPATSVEIPYPFRVSTTPQSALSLMQTLEASIRPFKLISLKIEGNSNNLDLTIDMVSYYQNSTGLQVSEKVVK
jgi:predicted small secreted protein